MYALTYNLRVKNIVVNDAQDAQKEKHENNLFDIVKAGNQRGDAGDDQRPDSGINSSKPAITPSRSA